MSKTLTATEIRAAYLKFFAERKHVIIPRANLVPQDDATTLFTGSGMQPLVPYLLGAEHPVGRRLADSQPSFRAEDIEEVGDNRHTTLFEMLGNWSLGDYFKAEQLPWFWEFLTGVVGLDPDKLYITAFIGDPKYDVPQDHESVELAKELFKGAGIEPKVAEIGSEADGYKFGVKPDERVFLYDAKKNWWNRGEKGPKTTPAGDPCGPSAEFFYLFEEVEHDKRWGEYCHPNCDCGRYLEIGNSVFMQYRKREDGGLDKLPKPNVDFGGGLERIAAAYGGNPDIFKIDLIWPIIEKLEQLSGQRYDSNPAPMRVIADHLRAATFLAVDGVVPSNTQGGYVMRRLVRRAIRFALELGVEQNFCQELVPVIADLYRKDYPEVAERREEVIKVLVKEEQVFRQTLKKGLREFEKWTQPFIPGFSAIEGPDPIGGSVKKVVTIVDGPLLFKLYDTYGFPVELSKEEAFKRGIEVTEAADAEFERLMTEQRDRSRTATKGAFKGGLADHSEIVTKYHTATHLLYKALRIVLGDHVVQRGSNITAERLRFDFSYSEKMTAEQIAKVEEIVNEQIKKDWPVSWREENTKEALASGVMGAFGDRYGDEVKVYTVGDPDGEHYSREICGGPHVEHTGQLGEGNKHFKITKEESSSAGVRRIKAVLV